MQRTHRLFLAGLGLGLPALLAGCTPAPTPEPMISLNFTLPEARENERLAIAALYTTRNDKGEIVQKVLEGSYGGIYGKTGSVYLSPAQLNKVLADKSCLPYRADKVSQVTEPKTVRTCDINFVAYDPSGGAMPTNVSLRYLTHDTYSYASEAFTYTSTFSGKDGDVTVTSQERGERRAGWSLVTHLVLNPSSNTNLYQVIRNSVDDAQLNVPRTMHAPSDYFTSMGFSTGGAQ